MNRRQVLIAGAISAITPRAIAADAYPNRPIRMVVPFPPGGSVDVVGRIFAEAMTRDLGQTVVVDNKGGAGGAIGTLDVVKATPDGYTLVMASNSITGSNPAINPNAGYNPVTDLTAIVNVLAAPTVLAVRQSFPARNYAEFLAEIKNNPDRYTYSSSGTGGILHLQMEVFKSVTGAAIRHVPFRGSGPAVAAVLAGDVDIAYDGLPSMPFVRDGRLRPIVILAPARLKDLPDVPTFIEVGVAPLNRMNHYGLLGPKGLPRPIVDRINASARKVLQEPAVRKRVDDIGSVIIAGTPEEFAAEIATQFDQLKKVVAERKLTPE